jgi:hypothetical protein
LCLRCLLWWSRPGVAFRRWSAGWHQAQIGHRLTRIGDAGAVTEFRNQYVADTTRAIPRNPCSARTTASGVRLMCQCPGLRHKDQSRSAGPLWVVCCLSDSGQAVWDSGPLDGDLGWRRRKTCIPRDLTKERTLADWQDRSNGVTRFQRLADNRPLHGQVSGETKGFRTHASIQMSYLTCR